MLLVWHPYLRVAWALSSRNGKRERKFLTYILLCRILLLMNNRPVMTERQEEVLGAIWTLTKQHEEPPTMAELSLHLGMSYPVSVLCHLTALDKKGYIQRTAGRARGLKVIDS